MGRLLLVFRSKRPIGSYTGKVYEPLYQWETLEDIFHLVAYDGLYFPKLNFENCALDTPAR